MHKTYAWYFSLYLIQVITFQIVYTQRWQTNKQQLKLLLAKLYKRIESGTRFPWEAYGYQQVKQGANGNNSWEAHFLHLEHLFIILKHMLLLWWTYGKWRAGFQFGQSKMYHAVNSCLWNAWEDTKGGLDYRTGGIRVQKTWDQPTVRFSYCWYDSKHIQQKKASKTSNHLSQLLI